MDENSRALSCFLSSSLVPTGQDAEETLHAIILGEADALVIETPNGPRVYTLRDAAEPYRELVERMSDAALVINADHTILYSNGGLARMLRGPNMAGRNLLSLVAPHQRLLAQGLLESGAKAKSSAELLLVATDGRETPVRASATPLTFDGLPCVAMVVTALDDIEALKISAAELRQSEERYRNLVEQAQDGILLADATGRIVDVNKAGHTMLGYTRDEFLSLTIADLLVPEEMNRLALALAELGNGQSNRAEWRFRRKDGSEFIGENVGRQLPDGHFIGIVRDVTERKRSEDALRGNEALMRLAADAARMTYAEFDFKNGRLHLADNFALVMGYAPLSATSRTDLAKITESLLSHVAPEDRAVVQAANRAFVGGKHDGCVTYRVIGDDGKERWIESRWTAETDENGWPERGVAAMLDITERKRTEERLRDSEERLRTIIEFIPDPIIVSDEEGQILLINSALTKLTGYTLADIPSRAIWSARAYGDNAEPIRIGQSAAPNGEITADGDERWVRTKSGDSRLWSIRATAAGLNVAGKRLLVAIASDLTERKRAEQALNESLKEIMDLKVALDEHAIVAITDAAGAITYVNDKFCAVSQYAREELLGKTHRLVSSGFHPPEFFHEMWVTISEGRVWRGEVKNRAKDGSFFWADTTIVPFLDAQGRPRQYVGIRADITARKRVEATLRENQQRVQLATATTGVGVWEWNLRTNAIQWDPQMFRIYGAPPTEDGMVDYDIWAASVLPEDLAEQQELLRKQAREGGVNTREFRLRRRDNGEIRVVRAVETVRADAKGQPELVIGTNLDVTESRRAEQALLESEERLRLALSGAKAAAWQWNIPTGELIWSGECFELYGRDPERLARYELWRQCLHPADLAPTEGAIRAVMDRTLPEYRIVYRVILPNGEMRWLAAAGMMEYGLDGTPLRLAGINIDITEQKHAEQQLAVAKAEAERASRAKSKFLAAASHDLRQPVQSLVLLLSLLARHTADRPKAADAVKMMQSAVGGLSGLLTGILDISRLDAGVVEPEMQIVDVGGLIAPLCDEHRERAASASLKLLCAPRSLWVRTDPVLLQRALRNLLENALRYTRTGGVLLGARTRGDRVRIDVIDTGIGVAADQQRDIFEEFFQAHNPGRAPGEGLGLGLAIVSRLAKLLGAEVEMRSQSGRGSRFSLLLPRAEAVAPAAPTSAAAEASCGRILVIEDNEAVRQGLVALMEDWGCQPMALASGEAALELIARQGFEYDAIVADYRLGAGLTGVATAREIAHRMLRKIPTLVLTGDTGREQIVEIEASGFDILHKPIDALNLRRALARIMIEA